MVQKTRVTLTEKKIGMFGCKYYDKEFFTTANSDHNFDISYWESHLNESTVAVAKNCEVICCFVNDQLNSFVISRLADMGVKLIALRSAGYNNISLESCSKVGIRVVRVPDYSPYAVAEHAMALLLGLNRKIHRAYNRVREHDFSLHGLLGFDLHGKTVGVVGTGKIGGQFCKILTGFGVNIIASDPSPNKDLEKMGVQYLPLEKLLSSSHIISLHCPLNEKTHHMIDTNEIELMRDDVTLINTSRGAIINTAAVIKALKSGKILNLGIDVYEEESTLFFDDHSDSVLDDDYFARLLTFPNVIVTGHQGFFTKEAMTNIAQTTLANIDAYFKGNVLQNEVKG